MNRITIEWCRNPDGSPGYSWNVITGCLNNCSYCYAHKLANGRLKSRYLHNLEIALPHENPKIAFDDPFYPRFWEKRLTEPLAKGFRKGGTITLYGHKPRGILVCDISDLFGIGIPEQWTRQVLNVIEDCPQDRFYLLTKQPQNLAKFSPFPDNCYVGITATNTEMLMQECSSLESIRAKLKYISIEPFLDWNFNWEQSYLVNTLKRSNIVWLILGAQTKPTVLPEVEWVDEIIEACKKANIPYFLKENLRPLLGKGVKFLPDWLDLEKHIPNEGLIRMHHEGLIGLHQEMPE